MSTSPVNSVPVSLLPHPALQLGSLPSNPVLLWPQGLWPCHPSHIYLAAIFLCAELPSQTPSHQKASTDISATNILCLLQKELRELKNNFLEDQTKPEQTRKHLSLSFSSIITSPKLTTPLHLYPRSAEALPWPVYLVHRNRPKAEN